MEIVLIDFRFTRLTSSATSDCLEAVRPLATAGGGRSVPPEMLAPVRGPHGSFSSALGESMFKLTKIRNTAESMAVFGNEY